MHGTFLSRSITECSLLFPGKYSFLDLILSSSFIFLLSGMANALILQSYFIKLPLTKNTLLALIYWSIIFPDTPCNNTKAVPDPVRWSVWRSLCSTSINGNNSSPLNIYLLFVQRVLYFSNQLLVLMMLQQSFEDGEKKPIVVGPWGGQDGHRWDDGVYSTVRQLIIAHGSGIDSIQIEYDKKGTSIWSEKHGGSGGTRIDKVRLTFFSLSSCFWSHY